MLELFKAEGAHPPIETEEIQWLEHGACKVYRLFEVLHQNLGVAADGLEMFGFQRACGLELNKGEAMVGDCHIRHSRIGYFDVLGLKFTILGYDWVLATETEELVWLLRLVDWTLAEELSESTAAGERARHGGQEAVPGRSC